MATYVVKSGDTLSKIALLNNTNVDALMRANPQITNKNLIKPGWVLTLPGTPSETPETGSEVPEPDYKRFWELVDEILTEIHTLPKFIELMEMINNGQRS